MRKASWHTPTERDAAPAPEDVDIAAIRARCSTTIAGKDAYPLFSSVGLEYGSSFQVLQEVYKGDDEVLGRLELPPVRDADFDQFVLHPVLLDASMQAGVVAQLADAIGRHEGSVLDRRRRDPAPADAASATPMSRASRLIVARLRACPGRT